MRPRGRTPGRVFTCNYYHFARLCAPVRAVVGVDTSWFALSHSRHFGSNYEVLAISRYLQDWSRKLTSNYRYFSYSPDTAHGFLDPGKECSFLSWETAMAATFREGGLVA